MAEYGKLLSRIWSDPDFTALDARPQQLYCLCISYSSRNLAGVLPMTLKRWAKSTRDGTVENVTEALKQLAAGGFVVVDWDTEEVLIRTYIRNDEVYRQPNLMKAARRFALQIESAELRWALHDELIRLPDPKAPGANEECANLLVEGLARTLREPFAQPLLEPLTEPFREPIPEPPGVGVSYVSGVREHQHLHPNPTPAAAAAPIAEPPPPPRRSRTFTEMAGGRDEPPPPDPGPGWPQAKTLVDNVVDVEFPDGERRKLIHQAAKLLEEGTAPDLVDGALRLWLTKPHLGPPVLPGLVSEAIKLRTAAAAAPFGGRPAGRASTKAADILSGAEELIAARHNHPNPQRAIEE